MQRQKRTTDAYSLNTKRFGPTARSHCVEWLVKWLWTHCSFSLLPYIWNEQAFLFMTFFVLFRKWGEIIKDGFGIWSLKYREGSERTYEGGKSSPCRGNSTTEMWIWSDGCVRIAGGWRMRGSWEMRLMGGWGHIPSVIRPFGGACLYHRAGGQTLQS